MRRSEAALEYAFTLAIALLIAVAVMLLVVSIAREGVRLVEEEREALMKELENLTRTG